MRDQISNFQLKRAISPVSVADNTAQVSQIIDRSGYDSLSFILLMGSLADADATFTVLVEDGDAANLSDAVAVADGDLIAQDSSSATAPEAQASFTFAADDQVKKIGYRGTKRYVRLTVTPAGNASAAVLAVAALLGNAEVKPVVQAAA